MHDLTAIESTDIKAKLVLAGIAIFALVFGFFAIRWQLGNMLAGVTDPLAPDAAIIAESAQSLAPADPAATWLLASTEIGDATARFEDSVRLAPFDERWRVDLGRSYEENDRIAEAEAEFKKAVAIAPNYAYPHWHLGNFYLRQGRNDEALAELKKAADDNQTYRDQVFSLAWDFFDKDASRIESLAGDRADSKARLAYFFAAHGRAADSLRNWNKLSDVEKAANPETARVISLGLYNQHYYGESHEFARQAGEDTDTQAEAVTNGSFEQTVTDTGDSRFDWQILRNDPKFETATDSKVKHDGDRSLKITFRNYAKAALSNVMQTVVVAPGRRYRLTFWLRTENLKSGGVPLVQIFNGNDDKLVAGSQPFSTGTNDWRQMTIDFAAPDNCSGISIRTVRTPCGDDCPISGIIWYDEFLLTKL